MQEKFGNPSSIPRLVEKCARLWTRRADGGCSPGSRSGEIYFTSGGTESNNMALRGGGLKPKATLLPPVSSTAVLDVVQRPEEQAIVLPFAVDHNALVDPRALEEAITPDTAMVSVMMANNEVGTIQPIGEMAALARAKGILFHTDAVQAVGQIPVNVKELQVDFLSLSAHKFNGPKGIGALYVRKGVPLTPLYRGGGQERKLRPGTENVAGIVGLARALELAVQELPEKMSRLKHLRDT